MLMSLFHRIIYKLVGIPSDNRVGLTIIISIGKWGKSVLKRDMVAPRRLSVRTHRVTPRGLTIGPHIVTIGIMTKVVSVSLRPLMVIITIIRCSKWVGNSSASIRATGNNLLVKVVTPII